MDSGWPNGGIRGKPEGVAIRDWHVLAAAPERTASASGNDNGASQMTMIKFYIASGLAALILHAALPDFVARSQDCAPVIECTTKELIE